VQELFSVAPDLATFGKAMGNGMPISAVVGRSEIMSLFEDVFISGTFCGETLSIAAAIAVINKMKREPVIQNLWEKGGVLGDKVCREIQALGLEEVFSLSGKPPWMLLNIKNYRGLRKELIRTVFIREMLANGVLMQGSHNISYAHTEDDLNIVLNAYHNTLSFIKSLLDSGDIEEAMNFSVIESVFQVR